MNTRRLFPPGFAMVERIRVAAAASLFIRGLLLCALAISVTVGGVLAGALVVAPVVARATRPSATARETEPTSSANVTSTATSFVRKAVARALAARASLLRDLPIPVMRYAPPVLAVISIIAALTAVFVRREPTSVRSVGRVAGNRQRTPRAVEAMAATGASTPDIAWRTGLPIDAVQLLLAISSAPRQLQPPTA